MSEIILLLIIILILYIIYGYLVLNNEKLRKKNSVSKLPKTENLEFEDKETDNEENQSINEQFNKIESPYEFTIPKTVNPFGIDIPYNEKLKQVQKYYKFNNKPYYKLGKSWRSDYTYDWCGAKGQQPIDALQYNDLSFIDKKNYTITPNKYFLKN
jgi:hypothetical protein